MHIEDFIGKEKYESMVRSPLQGKSEKIPEHIVRMIHELRGLFMFLDTGATPPRFFN